MSGTLLPLPLISRGRQKPGDEAFDDIDDDQIVTLQEEARSHFDTFVKQEQG